MINIASEGSAFQVYNYCVMSTFRATFFFTLAVLAISISTQLPAAEIYHWIDENGVQHFTQYRPSGDIPNLSTQELVDNAPPGNDQPEDIYNLKEHEKHMTAWREELEQDRKDARERKQKKAQQQVRYPEQYNRNAGSYWNRPIYGWPPVKPPPKPELPIVIPRSPPHHVYPRGINNY